MCREGKQEGEGKQDGEGKQEGEGPEEVEREADKEAKADKKSPSTTSVSLSSLSGESGEQQADSGQQLGFEEKAYLDGIAAARARYGLEEKAYIDDVAAAQAYVTAQRTKGHVCTTRGGKGKGQSKGEKSKGSGKGMCAQCGHAFSAFGADIAKVRKPCVHYTVTRFPHLGLQCY